MVEPSAYIPDLPELPGIRTHSTTALRIRDAISKQLPRMMNTSTDGQSMTGGRKEAAEEYAIGMRNAFAATRAQNHSNKMRARAKNRAQQRKAERR